MYKIRNFTRFFSIMTRFFRHIVLFLVLISSFFAAAQGTQKKKETLDYIDKYKEIAMKEMVKYKIPASITLAQGILESGNGKSKLATKGNNHFGIKCHSDWRGKTMRMDDDAPQECFRVYKTAEESYRDHSKFLRNSQRYASLFDLKITDYKAWAKGLKKAGYATLPTYAPVLINLIETYDLQKYDEMVVKGKFKPSKHKDKNEEEQAVVAPVVAPAATPAPTPTKPPKAKKIKKKNNEVVETPVLYECKITEMTGGRHYVRENCGVEFILTKQGDELKKLADELKMSQSQLRKYNNLDKDKTTFDEGEVLYIQPKRRRAADGYRVHVIQEGETLKKVSQLYAVRLDRLYKMNGLDENSVLQIGQEIRLR